MDDPYLLAGPRYVELNPVRAGLVARACDWPWSSARAHLSGRDDQFVKIAPLLGMIPDRCAFLSSARRIKYGIWNSLLSPELPPWLTE
jgi:putative transposase